MKRDKKAIIKQQKNVLILEQNNRINDTNSKV